MKDLQKKVSRRKVLQASLGAAGFMAGSGLLSRALAAGLTLTPPQTQGPFYPEDITKNNDNDLTRKDGALTRAGGEVVHIEGRVLDQSGVPVPGATVDVWQANRHGRYHHSLDNQNPAPIDPNLQIRGLMLTDSEGRYNFRTIIPGPYDVIPGEWKRPRHIHFMVKRLGYRELTTQMYFAGDPLHGQDRILQSLSRAQQDAVIVDFQPRQEPDGETVKVGTFDIVIEKLI